MSTASVPANVSAKAGHDDVVQNGGQLSMPLVKEPSSSPSQQNQLLGFFWTFMTAAAMLAIAVFVSLVAKGGSVPTYTQNFTRCIGATMSLGVLCVMRKEPLLPSRDAMKSCWIFGIADWFFLWGYVKSLIYVTALQYSSLNTAINPVVSALVSFALLGERVGRYKTFALLRNVALAPLIVDPFQDGASVSNLLIGFFWVCVASCGTANCRIVQRSNDKLPGTVLMFWGYALNALLWFPPGCIPPSLRVPVLWPSVPADVNDQWLTPATTWANMLMSGVFGAACTFFQGKALQHIEVSTFAVICTPFALVLSVLYSALEQSLAGLVWLGISLQILCIAADIYIEQRMHA